MVLLLGISLPTACLPRGGGADQIKPGNAVWLDIQSNPSFDGLFTVVEFQVSAPGSSDDFHYRWDIPDALGLGGLQGPDSGTAGGNRRVLAVFGTPGPHELSVSAFDPGDNPVTTASRQLTTPRSRSLPAGDRPGPYRTLEQTGDPLALEGRISSVTGGSIDDFPVIGHAGRFTLYKAISAGYFRVRTDNGWWYDLFVSPLPSRHVDRADRDWYLTQWNTETQSNCGPTATAMGISWATGQSTEVADIRRRIGWQGDGAVSLEELLAVARDAGTQARLKPLASPADIFDELARDRLVIISYNMVGIPTATDPLKDFVGQYYRDEGGHYLTLKGFSLDRRHVIVYDPIPSDWASNALRYADGVSMLGRNRYYPIDRLWAAMGNRQALVISAD